MYCEDSHWMTLDIMWLIFLHVLPALGASPENVSHTVLQTECTPENNVCYVLYQADREVITWQDAFTYCQKNQAELAVVYDQKTQDIMQSLKKLPGTVGDGHAWVAGRRSDDNTWVDVTGTTYTGFIQETFKASQTKCVQLFQHNTTRAWSRLEAETCFTLSGNLLTRALCQYKITTDMPQCQGYNESSVCYVPSPSFIRTWYGARMYCMTSYPGGDLAHTSLTSETLLDYFWETLEDIDGLDQNLWVGVVRNGWAWIYDGVEFPMYYYAWFPDEGAGLDEDCVLVDLNANSSWADKACNYTSTYFICQYDTTTESTDGQAEIVDVTSRYVSTTQRSDVIITETSGAANTSSVAVTSHEVGGSSHGTTTATFGSSHGTAIFDTDVTSVANDKTSVDNEIPTVISDITPMHSAITSTDRVITQVQTHFTMATPDTSLEISDFTTMILEGEDSKDDTFSNINIIVIVCTVLGLLLIVMITGILVCFTRRRYGSKTSLRSKSRPHGRYVGDTAPIHAFHTNSEMGDTISDWASVLIGDDGGLSDATSMTVGRALPDGTSVTIRDRLTPRSTEQGTLNKTPKPVGLRQYGATFTPVGGIFSHETSLTVPSAPPGNQAVKLAQGTSDEIYMEMGGDDRTANRRSGNGTVTMRERASLVRNTEQFLLVSDQNQNTLVAQGSNHSAHDSNQRFLDQESPDDYRRTIENSAIVPRDNVASDDSTHLLTSTGITDPPDGPSGVTGRSPIGQEHANTDSRYIVHITVPSTEAKANHYYTVHATGAQSVDKKPTEDKSSQTLGDSESYNTKATNQPLEPVYAVVNKSARTGAVSSAGVDVYTEVVDNASYSGYSASTSNVPSNGEPSISEEIEETLRQFDEIK